MTWHKRSRPGGTGAAKGHQGDDDHHQTTAAGDEPCDSGPRCPLCLAPVPDDPGLAWWLCWLLVGLPDPLPEDRWATVIAAVAEHADASTVARGLELAAVQPSMMPRHADGGARWWREHDRQRAAALAGEWRAHAQGVVTGVA